MKEWVWRALDAKGGKAQIVDVAKHIWTHHQADLTASGKMLYTWQYDMRWAATQLRQDGRMIAADECPRGVWALKRS